MSPDDAYMNKDSVLTDMSQVCSLYDSLCYHYVMNLKITHKFKDLNFVCILIHSFPHSICLKQRVDFTWMPHSYNKWLFAYNLISDLKGDGILSTK